jgi:hypothetical protein
MPHVIADPGTLIPRIERLLYAGTVESAIFTPAPEDLPTASAVLLPLGRLTKAGAVETCLILNKRSSRVRQPGDLCCPGGSVSPRVDWHVSRLLGWPFLSLGRWPFWRRWRRERPVEARWLALYFATALREGFEEMRINPLRIRFLGPLPPQRLVLFRRLIYPMAVWIPNQERFRPSWEVQRIVKISLRSLLDPSNYVRYRLRLEFPRAATGAEKTREHPGFRLPDLDGPEVLWGATYRITMSFLNLVFGFVPPAPEHLPVVNARLSASYLTGEG